MSAEVLTDKQVFSRTQSSKYLIIAFLIWPFFAFLVALGNLKNRVNLGIIYLFFILYGFTFVINPAMDGQRYASNLKAAYYNSSGISLLTSLYDENGAVDLLEPTLVFLVSRFTAQHNVLFALFACIFGYFYLKSIKLVHHQYAEKRNNNALIFFLFFPWIVPIFEINGFRFWTASWMFFFAAYKVVFEENRRFILLAVAVCFVHFSFAPVVLLLMLYQLLGNHRTIYFTASILTLFVSELDLQFMREIAASFDGSLSVKANRYLHEQYIELVSDLDRSAAWFMKLYTPLLFYFVLGQLIFVYAKMKQVNVSKNFSNLFSFTCLILSFSNISTLVPSGARFRSVYMIFAIALLVYFYSHVYVKPKLKWFVVAGVAPFLLKILISTRVGADTMNTVWFMPGPIISFMYDMPFPVKEWLF
jgi:hypothetical protein